MFGYSVGKLPITFHFLTTMDTTPSSVSVNRWEKPLLWIAVAVLLVGFFRNVSNPLYDRHSFRQTQTAAIIESLAKGDSMAESKLYVFGPPWNMPIEFPLYQKIVSWPVRAGMRVEHAARLVSMLSFLGCLVVMASFLRAIQFPHPLAVVAVIAVFPTYQMWARSCLIESTALLLSLLSLRLYWSVLHNPITFISLASLTVATCFATLQKLNAYLVVAAFVALYVIASRKFKEKQVLISVASVLAINVVVLAVWGRISDDARAGNLLAEQLTGFRHLLMLLGTIGDRLSMGNVAALLKRSYLCAALLPVIVLVGLRTEVWRALPGRVMVLLACSVAALYATFFKVYSVHDYYHFSTNLYLIAGILFLSLHWVPVRWTVFWFAGLVVFSVAANEVAYQRRLELTGENHLEPYALISRALTNTGDSESIVLVLGDDWSSAVNFTSGKKTLAIPVWYMDIFLADPKKIIQHCNITKLDAVVIMREEYQRRAMFKRLLYGDSEALPMVDFPEAKVHVVNRSISL